jgi:hypothetical protein
MKKKDFALIIVVAVFAGVVSLVISKVFFASSAQRNLKAEVVDPISADFQKPDEKVFNAQAINPTKLIQIGDSNNPQPF